MAAATPAIPVPTALEFRFLMLKNLHNYFDYHVCLSVRCLMCDVCLMSVTKIFFRLNRLGIIP